MKKRWTALLLACALLLTSAFFAGCGGEGDVQFTNPPIDVNESGTQPELQLEHYADSQTKEDSQRRAVSVTFSDLLMGEMDEDGLGIQSLQMEEIDLSEFDNGFVADITMKLETEDGNQLDRRVLGYFKTVQLSDGTYRTYYIYYNDVGQDDQIDDATKEEQLNQVLDKIQQEDNTSGVSSEAQQSSSENAQSSKAEQPSEQDNDSPESINDIDIDQLL